MCDTSEIEAVGTPILLNRLATHFGCDPGKLITLEQKYPKYDRANVHLAIEELLQSADGPASLCGIVSNDDYREVTLPKLSRPTTAANYDEGPVAYMDELLANGQTLSCVKTGLYSFRFQGKAIALLMAERHHAYGDKFQLEIMAASKTDAEQFACRLRQTVHRGNAFRGHVLSLANSCYDGTTIQFHSLPSIARDQVILPSELLDRIERYTIGFSEQAKRLKQAKRHLKRGLLLYGPPGTGKTFSAMYLASRMQDRTVFLLTGAGMGSIEMACGLARVLEPATIILEDVDLIGTQRDRQMADANALLFELLNQMDGLADDADILFLLTTNRPDVLEPALASRPGRIDQAIEVPLPDEECRRRLFALYSQGLKLDVKRSDEFIRKVEGVSAAFIREWVRKAAVFASLESSDEILIQDKHIDQALQELLIVGGPLTQSLLGVRQP